MTKNLINLDFSTIDELEEILDELDMEEERTIMTSKAAKERKGRPQSRDKKSINRTTIKDMEIE